MWQQVPFLEHLNERDKSQVFFTSINLLDKEVHQVRGKIWAITIYEYKNPFFESRASRHDDTLHLVYLDHNVPRKPAIQ